MPTPQRISLIEAYDNRDVIAWLVRHTEEIKDLQDLVDALPESDKFVLTIGDQTINGTKSFVQKIAAAGGIEADTLVRINADLQVYGDIYQNGAAYDTHAEQLYSTKDYILMRDGAVTALSPGTMSGLEIIKYDGTNNLRLAADASGVARIGDVGDEQPLLTRAEAADLVDGAPFIWDVLHQRAISGTFPGGESEWELRASNADWSDMILVDGSNHMIMRKDVILILDTNGQVANVYLPKGADLGTSIHIPLSNSLSTTNKLSIDKAITLTHSRIGSAYNEFKTIRMQFTFTISGSDIQISWNEVTSEQISKASFKVFTKG